MTRIALHRPGHGRGGDHLAREPAVLRVDLDDADASDIDWDDYYPALREAYTR